jgi:phage baseplate assembly protein W
MSVPANAHLLTDLRLRLLHHELRAVYAVDNDGRDLALVDGRENLGQAIVIRLLTPRGELTPLAHPDFGCRLHTLIGRQNTATTRNLMKLHILEALQAEPRIAEVVGVVVEEARGSRAERATEVTVEVRVVPVGETDVVVIGPFTLELSP